MPNVGSGTPNPILSAVTISDFRAPTTTPTAKTARRTATIFTHLICCTPCLSLQNKSTQPYHSGRSVASARCSAQPAGEMIGVGDACEHDGPQRAAPLGEDQSWDLA